MPRSGIRAGMVGTRRWRSPPGLLSVHGGVAPKGTNGRPPSRTGQFRGRAARIALERGYAPRTAWPHYSRKSPGSGIRARTGICVHPICGRALTGKCGGAATWGIHGRRAHTAEPEAVAGVRRAIIFLAVKNTGQAHCIKQKVWPYPILRLPRNGIPRKTKGAVLPSLQGHRIGWRGGVVRRGMNGRPVSRSAHGVGKVVRIAVTDA